MGTCNPSAIDSSHRMMKPTMTTLHTEAWSLDLGMEDAGSVSRVCVERDVEAVAVLRSMRPKGRVVYAGPFHKRQASLAEGSREVSVEEFKGFGHCGRTGDTPSIWSSLDCCLRDCRLCVT